MENRALSVIIVKRAIAEKDALAREASLLYVYGRDNLSPCMLLIFTNVKIKTLLNSKRNQIEILSFYCSCLSCKQH